MERDTILKEILKHQGIGDFRDFYNFMYDWLRDENFVIVEKSYTEKILGDVKNMEIKWEAKREITDYFRVHIDIVTKVRGLKEVEVEVDGKRIKTNEFKELEITMKGVLEKDYSGRWGRSAMYRFFKEVYNKYVIPSRTFEMEEIVREFVQRYKDDMKSFFDLLGKR